MDKVFYVIESLLDPTEDNSFSLVDEASGENKATVVIKDSKAGGQCAAIYIIKGCCYSGDY